MIRRICVYCASSNEVSPVYFDVAARLGAILAEQKIELVYGGGAHGLMGRIASSVLEGGGHVIGIMPHFMKAVEWEHKGVPEFHFVVDMHERKKKFLETSDALVALAGGSGTLEELLEAITLKRLGLYSGPIIIVNTCGYYDPLLAMLERCITEKFMSEASRQIWRVVEDPGQVLPAINATDPWVESTLRPIP